MDKNRSFNDAVVTMLNHIGEDPDREGLKDTPRRVQKAYEYMCGGYAQDPKAILNQALFSSTNNEMVLVRDIEFYSLCEHHMLPFFGRISVAYIPDGKVVGLSSFRTSGFG